MDFGCKHNILRCLTDAGCDVTVVPAETDAATILAMKPDGVFLSNGPGDPAATAHYAATQIASLIDADMPVFGICIGHQLMALAMGATTRKMERGHRGANHPVKDLATGRIEITSQNHGFVVDPDSLPDTLEITHLSLFDGSIEGLRHRHKPAFCVQYHPESSPGPHDSRYLFDRFTTLMDERKG
ncbi:MAG: carbamoyl phosphate synthase small subunit, partial [Candidatus Puniceispirillaceae bacterium]